MASFVLFIFTILLLPVARSAKCLVCEKDGGYSCDTSKEEDCAETCLSVSSNTRLSIGVPSTVSPVSPMDPAGHPVIPAFSTTCVDPSNYLVGSFSFDFGNAFTLDFTSKVCNETVSKCTFTPLVPPIRIYENGKSCPRCFRTGYDNCDADGEVLCMGELVDCIELKGEITHTYPDLNINTTIPFAGKGCASRSVCDFEVKSFRLGTFTFKFKSIQCPKPNGALSSLRRLALPLEKKNLGPQAAFLFPCILGIFAVKILS